MNVSVLGNINTHILLKNTLNNREYIISSLSFLEINRVVKSPWDFENVKELNLSDIPDYIGSDFYAIYFNMRMSKLMMFLTENHIEIKLVNRPNETIDCNVLNFINEFFRKAILTIVGFETEFYLNDFPASLDKMLNDISLYPIYVKGYNFSSPKSLEYGSYVKLSNSPTGEPEKLLETHISLIEKS